MINILLYFFLSTDIEMRLGYLGRLGDMNGHIGTFPDILHRPTHPLSQPAVPNSQAGTYSWLSQGDLNLPMTLAHPGNSVAMDNKAPKKENEDVDVMSTDSSSSSSSDSQ